MSTKAIIYVNTEKTIDSPETILSDFKRTFPDVPAMVIGVIGDSPTRVEVLYDK